jgi:UDP-GlcNAc:undecaprenyl-phosphate/decaprenyl-phosphate GlcNAc-1-phosphate transferase
MSNTILIYFLLNFIILFLCGKISYAINLVDIPNKRKIHSKATAYTGGIAISVILLFAIILFDTFNKNLSIILSIAFMISIVGFIDDKYNLNTGGKLSLQIIPIFYLVFFENLTLNNIGNYNYFDLELGAFAILFTFFSLLFLINSFNYFDGLDGTLGFTSISVLAILYFLASTEAMNHYLVLEQNIQYFLIAIIIPISVFLCFNFSIFNLPKLFLGDSGSLLLGFIISFILIYFANQNFIHPILLAWSIVIFVYEFLAINIIRIKNKQKLFKAGQDHLHHILLKKTKSVFFTNFIIILSNIILFVIGYLGYLLINQLASLILFIVFFTIFLFFRNMYLNNT